MLQELVMKSFKVIIFVTCLFSFSQCKKDKKIETFEYLLMNGMYSLKTTDQFGIESYTKYRLYENCFYVCYNSQTCCNDRKAGSIVKNADSSTNLLSLQIKGLTQTLPCIFRNDNYGGDTMITKFNNVKTLLDQNSHKALEGDFVILMYNSHPEKVLFGTFELNFIN